MLLSHFAVRVRGDKLINTNSKGLYAHYKEKSINRWWLSKYICLICTPIFGEMIQINEHIYQMGWFNHQPGMGVFLMNTFVNLLVQAVFFSL